MGRRPGKPPQQRQLGEELWEAFRKTLGRPLTAEQTVAALVAYELRQIRRQLERIGKVLEETEPADDDGPEPSPVSPWDIDTPPPQLTAEQAAEMIAGSDARLMRATVAAIAEHGPEAIDALATRALGGDEAAIAELRALADHEPS